MTAFLTGFPKYDSASFFNLANTIEEISSGVYLWLLTSINTSPCSPSITLYDISFAISFTSENLCPIKRFTEWIVFFGFVIACLTAAVPTRRSPDFVKATTDGVVLFPSAFGITIGLPFS